RGGSFGGTGRGIGAGRSRQRPQARLTPRRRRAGKLGMAGNRRRRRPGRLIPGARARRGLRRWLPPSSDWFDRFLENGRQTERPPWRSPRRGNDAAHGLSRRRCAGAELKQERKRNGSESEPEEG